MYCQQCCFNNLELAAVLILSNLLFHFGCAHKTACGSALLFTLEWHFSHKQSRTGTLIWLSGGEVWVQLETFAQEIQDKSVFVLLSWDPVRSVVSGLISGANQGMNFHWRSLLWKPCGSLEWKTGEEWTQNKGTVWLMLLRVFVTAESQLEGWHVAPQRRYR